MGQVMAVAVVGPVAEEAEVIARSAVFDTVISAFPSQQCYLGFRRLDVRLNPGTVCLRGLSCLSFAGSG